VFKASTSARMRQLLRMISVYGTGRKANAPGFRIGGKTGSAEKPGAGGGYNKSSVVATFAAAFPMDRPRYAIIVMLDEPKGPSPPRGSGPPPGTPPRWSGRVVPRIGPLLGVVPDDTRDIDLSDLAPLVPRGKGRMMLRRLAAEAGIAVSDEGRGPARDRLCDRSSQGRPRHRVRGLPRRHLQWGGLHSCRGRGRCGGRRGPSRGRRARRGARRAP
jgi:hypothetical protein